MLSMSATHWWFLYLDASPAGTPCSACDSLSFQSSTGQALFNCGSSVCAGSLESPVWGGYLLLLSQLGCCSGLCWMQSVTPFDGPPFYLLAATSVSSFTFACCKTLTHSNNLKRSYPKSVSWPHRTANAESRSEKAAWRVTSTTGHYTRGKLGAQK